MKLVTVAHFPLTYNSVKNMYIIHFYLAHHCSTATHKYWKDEFLYVLLKLNLKPILLIY